MTRAALLHVLDHATAIAPAEVRELEQLAQAFPYCQTAHLLLAKAAHDQGTMLAGQRLRRAATYAANRELLRRLIEQVAPEAPPVVEPGPGAAQERVLPPPEPAPAVEPEAVLTAPAEATPEVLEAAAAGPDDAAAAEFGALEITPAVSTDEAGFAPADEPFLTPPAEVADAADAGAPAAAAAPPAQLLLPAAEEPPLLLPAAEDPAPADLTAPAPEEFEPPAAAPPVRPPEDAGAARLEFGLREVPAPTAAPAYELPGLVDEWAAAAATLALAAPALATGGPAGAIVPALSPAAFVGDAALGYGLGGGSRLGFALQLLNSWEADNRAAETPGPAAPLPPVGEFFAPDALLLDHWAAHRPPDLPTPGDLINNFLRRQPRLTRPAMLTAATAGAQADLSARSTRPETELASEGLAQILVRQGKTARAIEIYERLMVKQPEKMAYFAAQIQQLQPPAQ